MSEKEKTNKKWTSNESYRNNYDAIFTKKHTQEEAMQALVDLTEEAGLYEWWDDLSEQLLEAGLSQQNMGTTEDSEKFLADIHAERLSKVLDDNK